MNATDKRRLNRLEQGAAQKQTRARVVTLTRSEWKAYRDGQFMPHRETVVILPPKDSRP